MNCTFATSGKARGVIEGFTSTLTKMATGGDGGPLEKTIEGASPIGCVLEHARPAAIWSPRRNIADVTIALVPTES